MRIIDADKLKDTISDTWILDRIDEQPTIVPVKWIPVSERLPSIPIWYLVTAKSKRNGNNFVRILHYNGEKYGWEEQSTCTVLAWTEMPKPWKGEGDDD